MPVLLTIEYGTTTFPPKRKKTKAVRNTPCLSQRFFCNIYEMGLDKPEMRSYALSEPSRAEPSRAEPSRAEPSQCMPHSQVLLSQVGKGCHQVAGDICSYRLVTTSFLCIIAIFFLFYKCLSEKINACAPCCFFLENTLDIWEARRYNGPESSEAELFGEAAAG